MILIYKMGCYHSSYQKLQQKEDYEHIIIPIKLQNDKYYIKQFPTILFKRDENYEYPKYEITFQEIQQLLLNDKSEWIKIHKPIDVLWEYGRGDREGILIKRCILMYMSIYGIDSTRGGEWVDVNLTDKEKIELIGQVDKYKKEMDYVRRVILNY